MGFFKIYLLSLKSPKPKSKHKIYSRFETQLTKSNSDSKKSQLVLEAQQNETHQ